LQDATCVQAEYAFSEAVVRGEIPAPPRPGSVMVMESIHRNTPRFGMKTICRQPLVMKPRAWREMDRDLIIACWELLKGQAMEELGYDPGKTLEMLAIFPDVETDNVERVDFDKKEKELHLYPHVGNVPRGFGPLCYNRRSRSLD
jgi:hypothetical protein